MMSDNNLKQAQKGNRIPRQAKRLNNVAKEAGDPIYKSNHRVLRGLGIDSGKLHSMQNKSITKEQKFSSCNDFAQQPIGFSAANNLASRGIGIASLRSSVGKENHLNNATHIGTNFHNRDNTRSQGDEMGHLERHTQQRVVCINSQRSGSLENQTSKMVNNVNGNKSNPLHSQTQQRVDNNSSHRSSPLKSQTSKMMNTINGHKFSSLHRETEHRLDNTNGHRLSPSGRKTSSQEIHSRHIVDKDDMQVDIEENAIDNANEVHEEENEIDDINGAYEEENNLEQAGSGLNNAASIAHDKHGSQSVNKKRNVPIDPITNKKIIRFDIDGNPVGVGSTLFVHDLGKSLRTHIPICFERWEKVPQHLKEGVWMDINKEYLIPKAYKRNAFKKMSKMFRNVKLRYRSHLDNCRTDAERIRNCPEYIRPEDWKKFIEIESTPEAYERQQRGKAARSKVTNYHITGNLGSARMEDIMKSKNPNFIKTRTTMYQLLHKRPDGTCCTAEEQERMEKLEEVISANPESVYEDIDNDPVAQVYGPDKRGNVRGLTDISRRTVLSSAFAREQLENETKKRVLLEDKVDKMQDNFSTLERKIDILTNALNARESIIPQHPSVDSISSHTRFHGGFGENHENLVQEPFRECPCELISFGNYMVARGRALVGHCNDVSLDVIIDEIIDEDAPLFAPDDSATTLGEICIGETIKWPNVFTKIIGG